MTNFQKTYSTGKDNVNSNQAFQLKKVGGLIRCFMHFVKYSYNKIPTLSSQN